MFSQNVWVCKLPASYSPALDNWKDFGKLEDNFTEGYVGLDLTDGEIYEWLESNYGEECCTSCTVHMPAPRIDFTSIRNYSLFGAFFARSPSSTTCI